ncbi:NlpC/P60 family protein [Solibacillus sp. FSL K6-1523]|uniref:NlpC/P60 family protein n=1 Tax=Solibacillus sp. FSL K6-1523 TaxID=2921471 RepID=UPI0030FB19D3
MIRKLLVPIFALCLFFTGAMATVQAQLFTDVPDSSQQKAELDFLISYGIIDAEPTGAFRIKDTITRYEAAEMLVRALQLDTELSPIPTYSDVAADDPRMPIIAAITEYGAMTGNNGQFNPDQNLTRAQTAAILVQAFPLTGAVEDSSFPDVPATHWAAASINILIANQITIGFEDGKFHPEASLTRGSFAVFMARVLDPSFRLEKPVVQDPQQPQEPIVTEKPQEQLSCARETDTTTYKVDVAVTNLWKHRNKSRAVDTPSTTNPVEMQKWISSMSLAQKKWLVDRTDTQALYGDEVTVLETQGNWMRVAANDQYVPYQKEGYPGWVSKSHLASTKMNYDDCAIAIVTAKKAPLYNSDATKHLEISYATILPVIKEDKDYYFVQTPSKGIKLLKKTDAKSFQNYSDVPKPSVETIIKEAKRFMDLPYLWAGTSSWGYDCSGILYAVMRTHGIMIPRDSFYQATKGTPVAKKDLKPGDFVFFAYNGGKGKVYHVGMYLGNGQMLHAPHYASKVKIESMNQGAYQRNYSGARRYL